MDTKDDGLCNNFYNTATGAHLRAQALMLHPLPRMVPGGETAQIYKAVMDRDYLILQALARVEAAEAERARLLDALRHLTQPHTTVQGGTTPGTATEVTPAGPPAPVGPPAPGGVVRNDDGSWELLFAYIAPDEDGQAYVVTGKPTW